MKPNWDEAPSWATHLAMDSDGRWYWYGGKPNNNNSNWTTVNKCTPAEVYWDRWEETLEQRPEA